jgi:group I intron endonuclease
VEFTKLLFLPFRLFTYLGSSSNLGMRFKYHYYNGPKQRNFLGYFLNSFGWSSFSIIVIEVCTKDKLTERENWYLSKYKPLLNVQTSSGEYLLKQKSGGLY